MLRIRIVIFLIILSTALNPLLRAHSGGVPPDCVDALAGEYLAIKHALSDDDLQAANLHGKALSDAFNRGPSERVHSSFPAIRRRAHRIGRSRNMASARSEFSKLAVAKAGTVENFERGENFELFLFRFEHALPNESATWILKSRTAKSPDACALSS